MFNFRFNFNFVPISSDFIENYMTMANGEYVKVYLYILNMAVKGQGAEPRLIARRLNLLESDVLNAIEFWQEKGLLSSDDGTITIGASVSAHEIQEPEPVTNKPEPEKPPKAQSKPAKKTAAQINEELLNNPELAGLNEIAQEFLGKTLNTNETQTLYWFYDGLGFSAELIMILLEYCVNKGKRDMRYIEQTAIGWNEQGIKTAEAAEQYVSSESDSRKFLYELKNLFGIRDRNFTNTEEKYIKQWHENCGMDAEMIALAYEYCVMSTNKLSFQYMDTIIRNWKKAGISTIEAAEKDHEDFKNKNSQKKFSDKDSSVYKSGGTDYSDLERRMNAKY
ncbi:MAG: DnaD domain protein [bacterium]|nr:DnaD domain protein [bacterium]